MNKKIITPLAFFGGILAILMWWFSATEVIKRRSSTLLECVHFEAGTSRVQRAHKAETLKDLIAGSISIRYPAIENSLNSFFSSDEAITLSEDKAKSALLYLTETAEWINIEEHSIEILSQEKRSAEVKANFTMTHKLKHSAENSVTLTGLFTFSKESGKWLLSAAEFSK